MIVYVGSPSSGSRDLLRLVVGEITSCGVMVFAPCLGFSGKETPEDRELIMPICLQALAHCHAMVALVDAPTIGLYQEMELSMVDKLPLALFIPISVVRTLEPVSAPAVTVRHSTIIGLRMWIHELQEARRNTKS